MRYFDLRQSSAIFGNLRQSSAILGNLRQSSAIFGNLQQSLAIFSNLRRSSAIFVGKWLEMAGKGLKWDGLIIVLDLGSMGYKN